MGQEVENPGRQLSPAIPAAGEKVTQGRLRQLLKSQRFRCALTGERLEPGNCSLDHILPRSRGGGHLMSNVQIVLKRANALKGTTTMEELLLTCRQILRWDRLKKRRAAAAAAKRGATHES